MRRSPKGLRLELGARDLAIMRLLENYRYLPSNYIHAFVGGRSVTRFKERLRDLYHEGLIDRPVEQWQFAKARSQPAVYQANAQTRRLLAESQDFRGQPRTYLGTGAHRQFLHSLFICQVLACLELGVAAKKEMGWIPWSEIRDRLAPNVQGAAHRLPMHAGCVIPDGIFGLRYENAGGSTYRFFALEIDRGTMPVRRSDPTQTSLIRKVHDYREVFAQDVHKSHLRIPNLLVLTITFARPRLAEIVKAVTELAGKSSGFLFQTIDEATMRSAPDRVATQLIETPWERAGCPPLSLAE